MIKKTDKFEKGASILEVLVVIVIGVILVGVAISQFGTTKTQFQRQNIAREFKNNLERCRFDSVRRRTNDDDFNNMSQIVITSSTSYEVRIDLNQDGVISSAEVKNVNFTGHSDSKILTTSNVFPITIRFNRKGHITTDASGTSINPLFTICSGSCSAATTITPTNANVISISPTGTVSMLYGGDVIPPLAAPNISNISSNSGINLWLTVMPSGSNTNTSSNTNTGTNTSTNTNANAIIILITPTPTPTPESTPTPQATPVPTTTPTPTLRECSLNEKPGSPAACQCSSPRYVRTNGKCQ